jgi:hypothetical protein
MMAVTALAEIWPVFRLRVQTPEIELFVPGEETLVEVARLAAERADTAARSTNEASLAVSTALGYEPNGTTIPGGRGPASEADQSHPAARGLAGHRAPYRRAAAAVCLRADPGLLTRWSSGGIGRGPRVSIQDCEEVCDAVGCVCRSPGSGDWFLAP